ncbi:MAG TPA: oligogalacturonate lyase family protein [Pricia sp.]|nr:oligogalacturonate lyase family protein [Pricia sp.]
MKPIVYWPYLVMVLLTMAITSCKEDGPKKNTGSNPLVLETGGQKNMPDVWIDADTRHTIKKVVDRNGNNRSFYFHNNPFLASKDGSSSLMIFYGSTDKGNQLFSINLKTDEIHQLTDSSGDKKGEIVGRKTRKVYYMQGDSVFATHIDTHTTEFIYSFPDDVIGSVTSLNADEQLLGGALITKEENDIFKRNPKKSDYFDKIYEAKLERSLITLDVDSGELKNLYSENAWLNHIQFSPTDPELLMYCHEGPWHKVDRIWTIDIKTKQNRLMHQRTVHREIAGHEFFSPDGRNIWFDLQIPRGETFYLANRAVHSDDTTRYALKRDEWSIHFNISPDLKSFAGDGGDESQVARAKDGMWLYHFTPQDDSLVSEKLVNMKHHDYDLEPNVHFSPDGQWIIFRANFEGSTQIYAVEIKKTVLDETGITYCHFPVRGLSFFSRPYLPWPRDGTRW